MLGLAGDPVMPEKVRLHDFTIETPNKKLALLKHLDGDRVFLVSEKKLSRGDMVIVKPPRGQKGPVRFRLDYVQETTAGCRAYGYAYP